MDIWTYFLQKEREFEDGGAVMREHPRDAFKADPDSSDTAGRVHATLDLTENAYVKVYERVTIADDRPTRQVYAYRLIIDEVHVEGWDRDPLHDDSPVHEHHGPDKTRERHTEPISLKRALERCWGEVSLAAEAPLERD